MLGRDAIGVLRGLEYVNVTIGAVDEPKKFRNGAFGLFEILCHKFKIGNISTIFETDSMKLLRICK